MLINKPIGISSFDVIRRLRRQTGQRKIGHAGTLDPLASGLMIMLFGTATKQAQSLLGLDKSYRAEVTLGATSQTDDAEGPIASESDRRPGQTEIEAALQQLTGEITQVPPAHSAIKIDGRRAYSLARKGESPKLPSRQVHVRSIKLLTYNYPVVKLQLEVSSGTYIRSLARDIGAKLTTGAYLSALERISIGPYQLSQAADLADLDHQNFKNYLMK